MCYEYIHMCLHYFIMCSPQISAKLPQQLCRANIEILARKIYIYIYIYIHCLCMCIYIYIYIYTQVIRFPRGIQGGQSYTRKGIESCGVELQMYTLDTYVYMILIYIYIYR